MSLRTWFWPSSAVLFSLPFLLFSLHAWLCLGLTVPESLHSGAMNFLLLGIPQMIVATIALASHARRAVALSFFALAGLMFVGFMVATHDMADVAIAWGVLYLPGSIAVLALSGLIWLAVSSARGRAGRMSRARSRSL
ncbi:MAG: hypothetical protein ACREP7_06565 [Lysobacter sp.]